jgi:hypothetical protein
MGNKIARTILTRRSLIASLYIATLHAIAHPGYIYLEFQILRKPITSTHAPNKSITARNCPPLVPVEPGTMSARRISLQILILYTYIIAIHANLEGPFLFFGPKSLEKFKRPALKYVDQDDLMRIYGEQAAIVVFNNQNSVPLSSGNFPRLRKMLEGQMTLVLPQDFLDVHPDYISNETQVRFCYYFLSGVKIAILILCQM